MPGKFTSWFHSFTRGRIVQVGDAAVAHAAPEPDGPLARMAKFVPVEVIAVYLFFVNGLQLRNAQDSWQLGSFEFWCAAAIFVACWIAAPCYYLAMEGETAAKKAHAWMAVLAFPTWAYAGGGPFELYKIHSPVAALLALSLATLVGMFVKVKPLGH